jgi:hypothetical protein
LYVTLGELKGKQDRPEGRKEGGREGRPVQEGGGREIGLENVPEVMREESTWRQSGREEGRKGL